MMKIIMLLSCILLLMNYSCKKKNDPPPVIGVTSPYQGAIYNIGDTVHVIATITDNANIEYVKVTLLNSNYIPVDAAYTINGTGKAADVDMKYPITNINLATDSYFINVQASDGNSTINAFQTIIIHEIPLLREAIYTITGSNAMNTIVWKVDTGNTITQVIALSGDFANAAISSTDQCLYTTGIYTGGFNCVNLPGNSLSWNIAAHNTGLPTYERVYSNNHWNLLADYDGNITGYDRTKTKNFSTTTLTQTYPHIMYSDSRYLYAEQRDYTGTSIHLKVYHIVDGIPYQEIAINEDIVAMFSINKDSVMIFTNHSGTGHAIIYNITNNSITTPNILPIEKIISAAQISPNIFLIAMQNNVYIYNTANFGTVNVFTSIPSSLAMKFDSLNQQLFIANVKTLNVYNYPSNIATSSLLFADTLRDISILYNK